MNQFVSLQKIYLGNKKMKLYTKETVFNVEGKTMRFVFGEGGVQCGVAFFVVLWLVSDWGRNLNIYDDKTVHRNYNSN